MKMFIRSFCALALLMAVLSTLSACEPGVSADGSTGSAVSLDTADRIEWARAEFTVQGMDCAGCMIATRTALRKLDGVKDAGASFGSLEASSAWALYDPARVSPAQMVEAIGELGYRVTAVESWPQRDEPQAR